MKSHITNLKHQQFFSIMENTIVKMEEIPTNEKIHVLKEITELKNNKNELERIYADYQIKLKELSKLLDDYERVQHVSRIHLRKMQLWLKFTYTRLKAPL